MYKKTQHHVHILLHPELGESKADKFINIFIITLIITNIIAVILETVKDIHDKYETFFRYFDMISVYIFTLEYALRLWSCVHDPHYKGSIKGRLKYMMSPGAIIDLLAFLPFYIHVMVGLDLRVLRILRLIRFLRLFRLTAYTQSAQLIYNVLKSRFNDLMLSFILSFFLVIIAACLVYFAEHGNNPEYSSIPASIWWAIVSLTTTGYGDMTPITVWGKIFASVVLMAGVALLALPAGIITTGFLEESRMNKKHKKFKCPHCGEIIHEKDLHEVH
jgi:voltage-gated potassium channel